MPTDKERLDWLTKNGGILRASVSSAYRYVCIGGGEIAYGDTPRQAIDAAMKAERTRKKEVGR